MSEDMKAELERLRNENAALKKGAAKGISMKVSEKGGLSIYGLGRFPVTLYKEQWTKLLGMSDENPAVPEGSRRGAQNEVVGCGLSGQKLSRNASRKVILGVPF